VKSPIFRFSAKGFTLIELMVTTAILSLILVMAMQVVESARNSIRIAESKSNNDAVARQVFDRISSDISTMQAGAFARIEFNTNNGNDEIAFLSSTPGLTDKGIPGKRAIHKSTTPSRMKIRRVKNSCAVCEDTTLMTLYSSTQKRISRSSLWKIRS